MTFQDEALPREKTFRDPILGTIIVDNQIILDLITRRSFSVYGGLSSWGLIL